MSPKIVALLSIATLTAGCGGERGDTPPERPAPAESSPAAATPRPPSEPGTFPGGVAAGATPEAVRAALDDPPSWRRIHHGDGCVVESWYSAELTHLGEPGGIEYHFYGDLGLGLAGFLPDDSEAYERALAAAGIRLGSAPLSETSDGDLTVARLPTGDFQWTAEPIQEQVHARVVACAH